MLASERKTDKKIDIVSRTIARPAQPKFKRTVLSPTQDTGSLRATPEIDAETSFESGADGETSFESSVDRSLFTSGEVSLADDSTDDPFIVQDMDDEEDETSEDDEEDTSGEEGSDIGDSKDVSESQISEISEGLSNASMSPARHRRGIR